MPTDHPTISALFSLSFPRDPDNSGLAMKNNIDRSKRETAVHKNSGGSKLCNDQIIVILPYTYCRTGSFQ